MASSESIDDDFGDFGGFEVAEPVVAEAAPAAASTDVTATPWTVMAAATLNPAPDALAGAQGLGGAETDQSASKDAPFAGTDGVATAADPAQRLEQLNAPGGATDWAALGEDPDKNKSGTSGDASAPLFQANFDCLAESSEDQAASVQQSLSEGNPSSSESKSQIAPEKDHSRTPSPFQASSTGSQLVKPENFSIDDLDLEPTDPQTTRVSAQSSTSTIVQDAANLKELEDTKANNQKLIEEKEQLQKELDDLAKENKLQTSRLEVLEHRLQEQRDRHEQIQAKHSTELDAMRQSGQKALAIIVEEYKEMCKAAVLQQQTESLKMLQELLSKEMEKHESALKKQEENYAEKLVDSSKQLEDKYAESLAIHRQEAKKAHEKELQAAVEQERQSGKEFLEASKVKWEEELEIIKKDHEKLVLETVQKEQDVCKEYVKNLISEQMKQHEESVDALRVEAQQKIKEYVQENRESERTERSHILHSSELFLEAAKQQIQLLLKPATSDTRGDIS